MIQIPFLVKGVIFSWAQKTTILDTSQGGLQPMKSQSGNLVISFNGEIYNHLDLRIELEEESQS